MIKEGCENLSALLILLIFYLKKSQKSNLSLDNKNIKWGEISLWKKKKYLMTTESEDLGLMSHPKDGAFFTV